jgi:hypothetical protein
VRRRDGDVVEQTEAHRLRGSGVVARWSEERHALRNGAIDHGVDHRDQRSCGQSRDLDALGRHIGVRVQITSLAAQLAERLYETAFVDTGELVVRCRTWLDSFEVGPGSTGSRERLPRCGQPFGALGVVTKGCVSVKARVIYN